MIEYPPIVQAMIDRGFAFVDMDGCVRFYEWAMGTTKVEINNSVVNITNYYER